MTPVVKGWKILFVILAVLVYQGGQSLAQEALPVDQAIPYFILGLLGMVVIIAAYSYVAWRVTGFSVDDVNVNLVQGVLFKQQRHARLDRIQAIDVVRPFLARILGLAELRIESAGGGDSRISLAYLKEAEAQSVRNEILARAAGVEWQHGEEGPIAAPEAPEQEIFVLSPVRQIAALALSFGTIIAVAATIGLVVAMIIVREIATLFVLVPMVIALVSVSWAQFVREFGFRIATSPDGLRLRHGLIESRAQTVPPGRVQALQASQSLLWRKLDWWRISINVAGYSTGEDGEISQAMLLPVGTRDEVFRALWLVAPNLGVEDPAGFLNEAMAGMSAKDGTSTSRFVGAPRRARWLDPVSWRRNGFAVTSTVLVLRRRRLSRTFVIVPNERVQSLGVTQGPIQRKIGVVTFATHSTEGPVLPRVPHLDPTVAAHLLVEQAERSRTSRLGAGPELWMRTPGPIHPNSGHPISEGAAPPTSGQPDSGPPGPVPPSSTPPGSISPDSNLPCPIQPNTDPPGPTQPGFDPPGARS